MLVDYCDQENEDMWWNYLICSIEQGEVSSSTNDLTFSYWYLKRRLTDKELEKEARQLVHLLGGTLEDQIENCKEILLSMNTVRLPFYTIATYNEKQYT